MCQPVREWATRGEGCGAYNDTPWFLTACEGRMQGAVVNSAGIFSIKQVKTVTTAPVTLPVGLPVTREMAQVFAVWAKSVPAGNPYPYPWENPYGLHYPCLSLHGMHREVYAHVCTRPCAYSVGIAGWGAQRG
ncbi:hypothetical protein BD779DRAFT_1477127 [Infundibulicybe gibba]|nr:hypothetical protein BD779DRAFT_1477127 [Infundibulicybe gibba]